MELGIVVAGERAPEAIPRLAAMAENAGLDQIWIAEDGFATGIASSAALALAQTRRIRVGLGVASALPRHPAVLALEIATLGRAHPHRFVAGIGLGVPAWLERMGLSTSYQLAAVRECITVLRELLAGRAVTSAGEHFTLSDVVLRYPPVSPVPLLVGAVGPRMLELAGEVGDGTILSVGASERYISWAKRHVDAGLERVGESSDHHELTVFAVYAVDEDRDVARSLARRALARHLYHAGGTSLAAVEGIDSEIDELSARGIDGFERGMPDQWVDELSISGEPSDCAEKIRRMAEDGVDSIGLLLTPGTEEQMLELTGSEVCDRL